jgi:hypothetical protein
VKTQAAIPELEREIDDSVIATVQKMLDSRRRVIGGAAPREQLEAEINFGRRLEGLVRHHLGEIAARMGV